MDGLLGHRGIRARERKSILRWILSNSLDLSALLMGSADDPARVSPFFWKPDDGLIEQSFRDFGCGNYRYVEWKNSGHIETTAGKSINRETIARKIAELVGRYRVRALAL